MRAKTKRFDCVRMKNDIQARMRRRFAGMTDNEIQAHIERELAASDSPAARLWRDLTGRNSAISKVAETPAKYTAKRKW